MTQKKRKFSEHILSISSKEQNLDIPKLESSQAPEANEPIATCRAVVQDASGSATAAQGQNNRGKRVIHVSSKQSGVPGVSWVWRTKLGSWQVFWFEEKKMMKKYFHVRHFMKTSKTLCEAEADALHAAIEFRKGLERSGFAKAKRAENPQSGVKGITWHIQQKAWRVYLNINGKQLSGGYFKAKDSTPEEVERARLAAVESRRTMEEKYFTIKQIAGGQEEAAAEAAVTLEEYRRLLALGGISKHLRGINIQRPWARLILDGLKTVEARKYELKGYRNEDLWIIETPGKRRRGETFVARIIGIVRFGSSFQYTDLAHWRAHKESHCIREGSCFDWQGPTKGKTPKMYGWNVTSAQALVVPQRGPDKKGNIGCKAIKRVAVLKPI